MTEVSRRDFLKGAAGVLGASALMLKRKPVEELVEEEVKGLAVSDGEGDQASETQQGWLKVRAADDGDYFIPLYGF